MNAAADLTDRQSEVLVFIRSFIERESFPPTLREIGTGVGIRSTNGVADHLLRLEKKGFITRAPLLSRGIRLTKQGKTFGVAK